MTPPGHEARIDLSITDDWPLAQAFVIISAVARGCRLKPWGKPAAKDKSLICHAISEFPRDP